MDETAKALWNEIQSQGIHLDVWAYVFIAGISMLTAVVTSYVTNYFRKRAEEDVIERYFYKTLERLAQTTKTTKEIEERIQQRYKFIESQLNNFYAPLVSKLKQIRAWNKTQQEVLHASILVEKEVNEYCKKKGLDYENDEELKAEVSKAFKPMADFDSKQFHENILPLYDEMLSVFTKNYSLANASTQGYYHDFFRYVAIWQRIQVEAIPGEALRKLEVKEKDLDLFYEDLEIQLKSLTQ